MTTYYKAFDGMEFDEEYECLEYEKEKISKVRENIKGIINFCGQFEDCDSKCPLYDDDCMRCQLINSPNEW